MEQKNYTEQEKEEIIWIRCWRNMEPLWRLSWRWQ